MTRPQSRWRRCSLIRSRAMRCLPGFPASSAYTRTLVSKKLRGSLSAFTQISLRFHFHPRVNLPGQRFSPGTPGRVQDPHPQRDAADVRGSPGSRSFRRSGAFRGHARAVSRQWREGDVHVHIIRVRIMFQFGARLWERPYHLNSVPYLRAIWRIWSRESCLGATAGGVQVSRKKPSRPARRETIQREKGVRGRGWRSRASCSWG